MDRAHSFKEAPSGNEGNDNQIRNLRQNQLESDGKTVDDLSQRLLRAERPFLDQRTVARCQIVVRGQNDDQQEIVDQWLVLFCDPAGTDGREERGS